MVLLQPLKLLNSQLLIQKYIISGWPDCKVSDVLRPYKSCKDSLSMYKGCILRDNRVVIPTTLRSKILNSLHIGHPGIVRMKALSRSYVWWPRIGNEIEKFIKNCIPCQSFHKSDPIDKESKWPISTTPWSRIHLDFAGPFSGKIFLIITDSYSMWLHVQIVPNTSSSATISCLRYTWFT